MVTQAKIEAIVEILTALSVNAALWGPVMGIIRVPKVFWYFLGGAWLFIGGVWLFFTP